MMSVSHLRILHRSVLLQIFFLFFLVSALGCAGSGQQLPSSGTLEGTVFAIGNDPFVRFGLQVESGEMYPLKCSRKHEALLSTSQGRRVKITYSGTASAPEGRALVVEEIELFPELH